MSEDLVLKVGGAEFRGWSEVNLQGSIRQLARKCKLKVSQIDPLPKEFGGLTPGEEFEVLIDGAPWMTGYIDLFQPSYSATDHSLTVAARSRVKDLVAGCVDIDAGEFANYTLAAIARRVARDFDINVVVEADVGAAFADVTLQPSETAFRLLDRLARQRGVMLTDKPDGALWMPGRTIKTVGRYIDASPEVLKADARLTEEPLRSAFIVRGQQAQLGLMDSETATQPEGRVDIEGRRHCPKILLAETPGDAAAMRERALWAAAMATGASQVVNLTVQGWRAPDGSVFQPYTNLELELPKIGIARPMVIESVSLSRNLDNGTRAQLILVPEEALTPEPIQVAKLGVQSNQWGEVKSIKEK